MRMACCLLLLVAVQAHAELVQHGTYVTDTVSGLDWMNTSLTLGDSYLQANSDSPSWRHATRREIDNLAMRYIGSKEGTYASGQDFNQTLRVIALLGITQQALQDQSTPVRFAVTGYYSEGSTADGVGLAEFSVFLFVPQNPGDPIYPDLFVGRWVTLDNFLPETNRSPTIANFMVRRHVP
jgi:hypothetical protein